MNLIKILAWSSILCLSAVVARGQETNQAEKLEQQLKQLQEKFEKQQQEMRENFERLLREQQAQIEATGLAPSNDLVSAIVRTLTPSNCTAIMRGVNDTTGVALVEVYGLN